VRILIYGYNYYPEVVGVGKYTTEFSEWMSARGHDVTVITSTPYYPEWRVPTGYSRGYNQKVENGVTVWRCPAYIPSKPTGFKRLLFQFSYLIFSTPICLANFRHRPDIVLVIEPPLICATVGLLTARLSGAKSVLHIQDLEVDAAFSLDMLANETLRSAFHGIEKYLYSKFDLISTISGNMIKRITEKLMIDPGRERPGQARPGQARPGQARPGQARPVRAEPVLFPNWVDTDEIRPLDHSSFRTVLNLTDEDFVCLYSGNIGAKQGIGIIIEAAKRLPEIVFVICGDGPVLPDLKQKGEDLTNVKWLPLQPLDKLNDLLNLADVHLLPQRDSIDSLVMPSKLTGMLASGSPVVATVPENSEIATVLNNLGRITEPSDVEAFTEAIAGYSSDAELLKKHGQASRVYAERYLSQESILVNFENCLMEQICKNER